MTGPDRRAWLFAGLSVMTALVGLVVGLVLPRPKPPGLPSLPPLSSSVHVLRGTSSVLVSVQNLSRLESAAFHMERVIDLSDKQSRLFGLVAGEDAILLVAVADVSAGVDLSRLGERDIEVSADRTSVSLALPPAELFRTALDPERTYVHTRRTDLLAQRKDTLETDARKEAERALAAAALEAGILPKADENARKVVTELLRSLGFSDVRVTTRSPQPASE
jgi:hypothetical protein